MCEFAQSLKQEGRAEGMQQGMKQGIQQGQAATLSLMQKLFEAGRYEDAKRVTFDNDYLNKLLKEFALS